MTIQVRALARVGTFVLDVDFASASRTTAILGASGAGKTLTLRAIAGLLKPSAGRITVDDAVLFDASTGVDVQTRRRRTGYVFQDYALFPHLTVAENLAFGLKGVPGQEVKRIVAEMINLLELQGLEDRGPQALSGGQQQRVAVGRALAPKPKLLLLDEPFAALDAPIRTSLTANLASLWSRIDIPTVLVTHDVAEAYALAGWVVVLEAGRVLQSGPRAEVFHSPASPEVARLVGVQNIVPGVVEEERSGRVTVNAGGVRFDAPASGLRPGAKVTVGIRAADMTATPNAGGNAKLVREIDRGMSRIVTLRTELGDEFTAELSSARGVGEEGRNPPESWEISFRKESVQIWQEP
jgi:molybdate transport system ATP-binding protein